MDLKHNWKIGAVSYLNSKPLVYRLEERLATCMPGSEVIYDLPSNLAKRLADGQVDVALVPSIETLHNEHYEIVSDACIACRGPVWSVKLLSRCPLNEISTLATDEGSRTSVALVQILLAGQHHVYPKLLPLAIDEPWQESSTDAVLIIGDRAMNASNSQFEHEIDLGKWWNDATGDPFVFAMWVSRGDNDTAELGSVLSSVRDTGMRNVNEIARKNASNYGLLESQCLNYFQENLHFELGSAERAGLKRFGEQLKSLDQKSQIVQTNH